MCRSQFEGTRRVVRLAFFRGSWRHKKLLGFSPFSFEYLAFLVALGPYYQNGVFAF